MTLTKISERIYADIDGINGGNYGAIVLDNEIVFVDSGMIHSQTLQARKLLEEEYGLPILKLILTHYHGDHVWGAQGLGDVTIISSAKTRDLCINAMSGQWSQAEMQKWAEESKEERPALWKAVQTLTIKLPDLLFDDGILVGPNQEITIKHVGGHTPGSSIVAVEPEHICFCGDIIFNKKFPYAADPGCNPDRWISVLEEIKNADYETIIPGHGGLCDNDEVQVFIEFLKEFRNAVKEGIVQGLTVDEFVRNGLTPDYYKNDAGERERTSVERWYAYFQE